MKHFWKRAAALALTASLCLSSPAVALAATKTVNNFKELTSIFRDHALKRDLNFRIKFNISDKELEKHILGPDDDSLGDFWDGMVSMMDDPNTSDDADYIVGNLNWSNGLGKAINNRTFEFKLSFFETLPQTEYVNQHVPEILQEIGVQDMDTNYEKVRAIHDWVCEQITYTSSKKDIASTCYGAITKGKVLCNGYALCLYKLLVGAGIPCKYIGGKAGTGRDSGGHAWNIVALGDKWYYVDATWDDEDDRRPTYDYFLKGKKDFDESDPSQYHKLDYGYTTFFAKAFPVANSSFNPTMMDSTNNTVKIGSELPEDLDVKPVDPGTGTKTTYKAADILEGTYPSHKSFTLQVNKTQHLQLFIKDKAFDLVDSVGYRVRSGKENIKNIKNNGFDTDWMDDSNFTDLTFKGKKQGSVKIDVILKLTNNQQLPITFTGKIR